MHQMRISTTKVSSVVLRPEKVGSPKIVGKSRKYQILSHEIEPNPSKDRSMHEGDNPSFLNEFMKFTLYLIVVFIIVF